MYFHNLLTLLIFDLNDFENWLSSHHNITNECSNAQRLHTAGYCWVLFFFWWAFNDRLAYIFFCLNFIDTLHDFFLRLYGLWQGLFETTYRRYPRLMQFKHQKFNHWNCYGLRSCSNYAWSCCHSANSHQEAHVMNAFLSRQSLIDFLSLCVKITPRYWI